MGGSGWCLGGGVRVDVNAIFCGGCRVGGGQGGCERRILFKFLGKFTKKNTGGGGGGGGGAQVGRQVGGGQGGCECNVGGRG